MKKFKLVLSTILAGLLFGVVSTPVLAAGGLTVNFETTPLFQVSDGPWMPGNTLTRKVDITNNTGEDLTVKVETENVSGLKELAGQFDFWVYDSTTTYFLGSLKEFMDGGVVSLADQLDGGFNTYYFFAQFAKSSGNEWQNKIVGFDLVLNFSGEPVTPDGPDGVHLVCAPTNQCVIHQGEGDDDSDCGFAGDSCNFVGTGDLPDTDDTTLTTTGSGVFGAAIFLGEDASVDEEEKEEEKKDVKGASVEEGVVEGEEAVAECCCLWWVFILLQIVACAIYLIKNKGRNVTYGRLVTVWVIFGAGSFILFALLCNWLQNLIGCIWPSSIIPVICKWYWYLLIDLFVLILIAVPYFIARSGLGKSDKDKPEASESKPIQSFLKNTSS